MLNRRILAFVAVLALVVCAAPADAQQASRPYRGLFGGSGQGPQSLGLNMSFFGAYDSNVLASQPTGNVDPRYQQSGGYGGATASLDYNRNVGQTVFDFSGGTSYRYYPSYKAMNGANSFASAGLSTKLSPRTTLKATESAAYSPYYSLGALPGAPPGQTGDVAPSTRSIRCCSSRSSRSTRRARSRTKRRLGRVSRRITASITGTIDRATATIPIGSRAARTAT